MSETSPTVTDTRFETASITTLRHALLADADTHENRAAAYSDASTGTEMAAWCGLLLAASHNRMAAALLGLLDDPRVPADLAERGRSLVGQVLAGWPEVLEGANDDLPAVPVPQIEGQTVIALVPGGQGTAAETRTCTGCDGTGERRDFNADGEFESVERCGGCDGTGRVAIEDESCDEDAPTCRDCGTWPCGRHATAEDKAEYAQATSSESSATEAESGSAR